RTRKVLLTLRTSIFSKSNYRSSEHLSPFLRDDQLNRHDWPRLVWGVAAAAGVSVLLTASELAYTTLRIAGAIYLIWMGVGMLRGVLRRRAALDAEPDLADSSHGIVGSWARAGWALICSIPRSVSSTWRCCRSSSRPGRRIC
ncbi:LysE family translocator, partial [Nocardia aurantiaca]